MFIVTVCDVCNIVFKICITLHLHTYFFRQRLSSGWWASATPKRLFRLVFSSHLLTSLLWTLQCPFYIPIDVTYTPLFFTQFLIDSCLWLFSISLYLLIYVLSGKTLSLCLTCNWAFNCLLIVILNVDNEMLLIIFV